MQLQGKTVLVTGADGFIGSHLVEALLTEQCHVKAFVYYNAVNRWGWLEALAPEQLQQVEIICGDIADPFMVESAVQGCEVVFHLAALIAIPYSYHAPASYVATNVQGTLNLFQAARKHNVQKFIQTSTSEVYGTAQTIPIDETHPLNAQSPYAASKIAADQFALSYHASFELPVCVVRPFNTYGPRQSARAIIPTVITQIAAGQTTLKLGNVSPTRDFSFVTDTANGFIAAAKSDMVTGEVINFGSQFEISVGDTVQLVAELMNTDVKIETDEQRIRPKASEVERLFAAPDKALKLTEWRPQYSGNAGFKQGLQKTIEWFSCSENLKCYKSHLYNL